VPYFDPGVWGGQWMKEVCGLDPEADNYAWSVDGVPEENSLFLRIGDVRLEVPAQDLVLWRPVELLGMKNYCRFGAEFPIRFDFLDTMGGQNLSLQVHPMTEYIRSRFGMTYTQDESYYILDAKKNSGVYLGLREGIDMQMMADDLRAAEAGKISFPAEKYVNFFPCRKHDHFLIPAGTIHCSAADTMVLEISATPYNFTFKLWDWDRVGLDGLPRPIHIEDGLANIQWNRTTAWVRENLVNQFETLSQTEDVMEERTGLHEYEFIETRRFTQTGKSYRDAGDGFHICNLIDGREAVIESEEGAFAPYTVHYAETFIIPAAAGRYTVRPAAPGEKIVFIKAYVRNR
jgi:mannose-6-phosphate isomerase class I